MSQLLQILSEFRAGRVDQAALFARMGSLVSAGERLDDVLGALQEEHATSPLPLSTFVALRKHLNAVATAISSPAAAITPVKIPPTEILNAPPPMPTPEVTEEVLAAQAVGVTLAGRFRLAEYIGSGGTSRLYKAIDQRKVEASAAYANVAVKILTLPFKDTLEALAVLHRETEGLRNLAHPNIVRVFDCDRDGDTVFMTMEFIRGKTLHALMRGSRFLGDGRKECLPIVYGIANAIGFAHSKSIVHGDLTPGNVMIDADGAVKVIDFGIWRVFGKQDNTAGEAAQRANSRGEITGFSPSYASPEMIELRAPDPRDDIYSLACVTWQLLTGTHPFGKRNAKTARDEGIKLDYNDKLTRTQYAALAHALAFDRERRTPTIDQFLAELTASAAKRAKPFAAAAAAVIAIAGGSYLYLSIPETKPVTPVVQSPPVQVAPPPTTVPPSAGTVFRDCPTCPLMTAIPAGEFMQGSTSVSESPFELPQHRVTIARTFAAGRTEVTVGEFSEFAQATGREMRGCETYNGAWNLSADVNWKNAVAQQTSSYPASCVSWADANAYAQWLSVRTGQTYRLPSASEWEYAARAGSAAERTFAAEADACANANTADQSAAQRYPGWTVHKCNDSFAQAAPVASFAANAFGLHDTLGNVFEWVSDCWNETYDGAPSDGTARRDGDCSQREMRGGSWFTAPTLVRFAYRNRFAAEYRSSSVGFRVVREITL